MLKKTISEFCNDDVYVENFQLLSNNSSFDMMDKSKIYVTSFKFSVQQEFEKDKNVRHYVFIEINKWIKLQ